MSKQPTFPLAAQLAAAERARRATEVDLSDTVTGFAGRSTAELRAAARLFSVMARPRVNGILSRFGAWAVSRGLPLAERVALATIYPQFVGGQTLAEAESTTAALHARNLSSALDFAVEGKDDEAAFDATTAELLRAIAFAGRQPGVPIVAVKLSGLASDGLLARVSARLTLEAVDEVAYAALAARVDHIVAQAAARGVQVYVDAEESWLQHAIDEVALGAILRHNRGRAVVFQTYQLYRRDRYAALLGDHARCRDAGVFLGAKLVRGAYMDRERERARDRGYPDPIHATKADTDRDFDRAVAYCLAHVNELEFCNASHNVQSVEAHVARSDRGGLPRDHPHITFCQLYGMSDVLSANLAAGGFRVAKYLPYGPVAEVLPYLVRRARENSSVTGEVGRELRLLRAELSRRGKIEV